MFYASVPDVCSADSVSLMSTVANVAVAAGCLLQYSPPYLVDYYILRHVPRFGAHLFAMIPVGQALRARVGSEEREKSYAGAAVLETLRWSPCCQRSYSCRVQGHAVCSCIQRSGL